MSQLAKLGEIFHSEFFFLNVPVYCAETSNELFLAKRDFKTSYGKR
jgi:hypothetical protein